MALSTANVLSRMSDLLLDSTSLRWPTATRYRAILDAQREIIVIVPGSGPTFDETITLAPGVTQEVAETISGKEVARVADYLYNVKSDGSRGDSLRRIGRDQLDTQRPGWMSSAGKSTIKYVMPLDNEPRRFMVYPPAGSGATQAKLRVSLYQMPNAEDGTIYLRTQFMTPMIFMACMFCELINDTFSDRARNWLELAARELSIHPNADREALERLYKRTRDYSSAGAVPNTSAARQARQI